MLKIMLAALVVAPAVVATANVGKVVPITAEMQSMPREEMTRDEAKAFLADLLAASDQVNEDLTVDETMKDLAGNEGKANLGIDEPSAAAGDQILDALPRNGDVCVFIDSCYCCYIDRWGDFTCIDTCWDGCIR